MQSASPPPQPPPPQQNGVSSFMNSLWGANDNHGPPPTPTDKSTHDYLSSQFQLPPSSASTTITTPATSSTSPTAPPSKSRPATSSGLDKDKDLPPLSTNSTSHHFSSSNLSKVLSKDKDRDRRPSFHRKPSASSLISSRRGSAASSNGGASDKVRTDASAPPALPDYALAAAAKISSRDLEGPLSPTEPSSFSKMIRPSPVPNGYYVNPNSPSLPESSSIVHQHIQELANKRVQTLDYLRKAHEGRIYWFNTLMFDKPDFARMPYFDTRKLARRATNYLLLGLSLPVVVDLNSSTPLEYLRSLNTLLAEFESYQQIHTENGINQSSLSRARLPQMFRRGAGGKGRRQSAAGDMGYPDGDGKSLASGSAVNSAPTSVINFGLGGEGNDLVPGEEYTHLLTPNLPFEPDFFETFATLCDVLIDVYTRLMNLLPTPKDCNPAIAELFTKADAKVRKIIIQGVVKEFEDTSRQGLKQEVGNIGKVVMGGLVG